MSRNTPPIDQCRRELLIRAGALASTFALPFPIREAAAQDSALNALPRIALIIGNTKYVEAPLRNPANDAKALGGELQKLGFQVTTKLEATRSAMIEAIGAYTDALARRKAVGLFYYAGHGAQLAWKNYLIPVDAVIEKLEDMQSKTVDLAGLLGGLGKAKNPMNVVILDACRDNPFGTKVHPQQRGLSQFDAPGSSLLAYATAPGNVASDGEGANGLYTENLVRELRTPEAKIEDVFKRVRLNVRRKSEGQQIPWESTSLEEDFYFQPPKHIQKLSEQELERQYNAELAEWEKIKECTSGSRVSAYGGFLKVATSATCAPGPALLEGYLRHNPSGRFAELAQYQLDRVLAKLGEKKIELINAPENPFTKGTGRIDTRVRVGDVFQFRELDLFTRLESRTFSTQVTNVTDSEVHFNNGRVITDLFGNLVLSGSGARYTEAQFFIPEYTVGKKWTTRFTVTRPKGNKGDTELDFKVTARERVTVPAGTFDAFRVEGNGWSNVEDRSGSIRVQSIYWLAPEVRRPVAREDRRTFTFGAKKKILVNERQELISFKQSSA